MLTHPYLAQLVVEQHRRDRERAAARHRLLGLVRRAKRAGAARPERPADTSVTIVFLGYTEPARSGVARRFEDEVLALLPEHGAEVLFRGRRSDGQDPSLPLEVHVLRFPGEDGLAAYLRDPRRQEAIDSFGEVFRTSVVLAVEPVRRWSTERRMLRDAAPSS